jgi:hypothetical protein
MADKPPVIRNTFISTKDTPSAKSVYLRTNSLPVSSSGRFSTSLFNELTLSPELLDMFPQLSDPSLLHPPTPATPPTPPKVISEEDGELSGWRVAWVDEDSFKDGSKKQELSAALSGASVSTYKSVDKFWRANGKKIYSDNYMDAKVMAVVVGPEGFDQLVKLLADEKSAVRLVVGIKGDSGIPDTRRVEEQLTLKLVDDWSGVLRALEGFFKSNDTS